MEYEDDDENHWERSAERSASPPKEVDIEKIKPNTEENKGEIRLVGSFIFEGVFYMSLAGEGWKSFFPHSTYACTCCCAAKFRLLSKQHRIRVLICYEENRSLKD